MEAAWFIETQFPNPGAARKWLREKRPDLDDRLFPKASALTPRLGQARTRLEGESVGTAIRKYLEKHPDVRGVFWGKGGGTTLRRYLHPLESRFIGLFTADNRWDRWVKLLDKGRLTSLDDPEVRALASRYGDPDKLLAEDWRPEIPGINAPGAYAGYANDPWKTVKRVIDQANGGQ